MPLRAQSPAKLLARTRDYDFTSSPDAELKDAFSRLQSGAADDVLPECFAIVAEAIDRRLGVWRLFDDSSPQDASPQDASPQDASPQDASPQDAIGEEAGIIAETVAHVTRQRKYRRPGDVLLPDAFYRAARRQNEDGRLRFRATGEQLLAGIHLFKGMVVQMDAGEGKTVAIAFAAALHAVLGRRVHVVTANDYLAERDAALLEPVYRSLGLSVGAMPAHMEQGERRHVYRRSIVYGAMRELGFDLLRDSLKSSTGERVQQPLDVAILDEADHALIDEAFTPLIISGNPVGGSRLQVRVNGAVAEMIGLQRELASELSERLDSADPKPGGQVRLPATLLLADPDNPALSQRFHARPRLRRQALALADDDYADLTVELYYAIHPGNRFVTLTEKGREFLERRLSGFRDSRNDKPLSPERSGASARRMARRYALENQVSQALTAHLLLKRDVDYLVDSYVDSHSVDSESGGDSIVLIDPHTGRPKPDSIYQHGLQSAVEAREGVAVKPDRETLAQVSVSGFVSRYRQVAGITGTAASAAGELWRKYGLEVAVVPPINPPKRSNRPPVVYATSEEKLAAAVDEIAARHRMGQPVLASTRTVEQSEELSWLLEERGVPHRVLNAVTTHAEARIVRDAGAFGAVTVATHMAGRGTDILLEPDLNSRMARQCAAEIRRMLTDEAEDAGEVEASCPSPEQAAVLREFLACDGELDVDTEAGRTVLRVSPRDNCSLSPRERVRVRAYSGKVGKLDFALGLCVIGTEIHDSGRITLQLNGRSGRQGQFGLTLSFLSLEDRLVNLDADSILKLTACRRTDGAGRAYYAGPEVTRRIERLQAAAEQEGEAQRGLIQDYAAELDRQTRLYYQRRQKIIESASEPGSIVTMCREVAERVASRLAAAYLGPETDGDYPRRFEAMEEEARSGYGADCSPLYGLDLSLLPGELARVLTGRLEEQSSLLGRSKGGASAFPEAARLLYLQVCGDLWPAHIAILRDSIASQLLSSHNHKSAVAAYIRRGAEAWRDLWERVDAEFLSRLATLPLAAPAAPAVEVSGETELLLAQE